MLTLAERLARIVAYLSGHQLRRPRCLVLESTSCCQFSCDVCGAAAPYCSRPRGLMNWTLFEHLVEQVALLRPERVCLHAFGEPLLHPQIVEMVEALSRRNLEVELVTNGDLLTPALSRRLREAGLFELGVSHPNLTAENYQLCRQRPPPPDADARLAAAVAEWEGHNRRVSIRCLTIKKLLRPGGPELGWFLDRWLSSPGVGIVAFHCYLPWPKRVCPELMDFMVVKPRRCQVGMRSLSVLWDGVITPCSFDVDAELALGRAPQDSLIDIYRGGPLRKLRKKWMRRSRDLPALCRQCLLPRCPASSAWVGREEWHSHGQQHVHLLETAMLTLQRTGEDRGDWM